MTTQPSLTLAALAAILLLGGCATDPGAAVTQDTTKYTIENTEKFARLDKPTQTAITCTGLQERLLPDGRLEVVASVRNSGAQRMDVQINCVFKDAQGFTTGDETEFQKISLTPNSTEAVRFTAADPAAKKYTIRVRRSR
ncbi:MAG: YcfL family protein [Opitutaceae bacterium]|nr:YcfL family protein [Opitutaceae bacterium]MBP9912251.1 YcfL family protein [Opitutaceae bacterium]